MAFCSHGTPSSRPQPSIALQSSPSHDLVAWLSKVVLPERVPEVEVPKIQELDEFQDYVESTMPTWTEQWKAEGVEQGVRQGIQKGILIGRVQAARDLLRAQIEQKFNSEVASRLEPAIRQASENQVQEALKRILVVDSADDLFTVND